MDDILQISHMHSFLFHNIWCMPTRQLLRSNISLVHKSIKYMDYFFHMSFFSQFIDWYACKSSPGPAQSADSIVFLLLTKCYMNNNISQIKYNFEQFKAIPIVQFSCRL